MIHWTRVLFLTFLLGAGWLPAAVAQSGPEPEEGPSGPARAAPGVTLAADVLFPGRRQLRAERNLEGVSLASAGIGSVLSLGVTQWLYNRRIERSNSFQADYEQAVGSLRPLGDAVDPAGFITQTETYRDWQRAYNAAHTFKTYRNVALYAVAAVYALNLVDLWLARSVPAGRSAQISVPHIRTGGGAVGPSVSLTARITF